MAGTNDANPPNRLPMNNTVVRSGQTHQQSLVAAIPSSHTIASAPRSNPRRYPRNPARLHPSRGDVMFLPDGDNYFPNSIIHQQKRQRGFWEHPLLVVHVTGDFVHFYAITSTLPLAIAELKMYLHIQHRNSGEDNSTLMLVPGSGKMQQQSYVNLERRYKIEWQNLDIWRFNVYVDKTQLWKLHRRVRELEAAQNRFIYTPLPRSMHAFRAGTIIMLYNDPVSNTRGAPVMILENQYPNFSYFRVKECADNVHYHRDAKRRDGARPMWCLKIYPGNCGCRNIDRASKPVMQLMTMSPQMRSCSYVELLGNPLWTTFDRCGSWCWPPVAICEQSLRRLKEYRSMLLHSIASRIPESMAGAMVADFLWEQEFQRQQHRSSNHGSHHHGSYDHGSNNVGSLHPASQNNASYNHASLSHASQGQASNYIMPGRRETTPPEFTRPPVSILRRDWTVPGRTFNRIFSTTSNSPTTSLTAASTEPTPDNAIPRSSQQLHSLPPSDTDAPRDNTPNRIDGINRSLTQLHIVLPPTPDAPTGHLYSSPSTLPPQRPGNSTPTTTSPPAAPTGPTPYYSTHPRLGPLSLMYSMDPPPPDYVSDDPYDLSRWEHYPGNQPQPASSSATMAPSSHATQPHAQPSHPNRASHMQDLPGTAGPLQARPRAAAQNHLEHRVEEVKDEEVTPDAQGEARE